MYRISFLFVFIIFSLCSFGQDTIVNGEQKQFFYPNGSISSEGLMRDGQPDGYWKAYYENGILKSEGNRKDFQLDSIWRFYNPEGKVVLEITYKNGKRNGTKTSWLDKETIKESYSNDIKNGYTEYYHIDGWKKKDIPFVKGLEQGVGKEYSSSGEIITVTEYKKGFIVDRIKINRKDKHNRKQGKWITFWDNGKYRTEGSYKNNIKHGYFKFYSKEGNLLSVSKFVDSVEQEDAVEIQKLELEKTYYPDGKLKSTSLFRNGILEGISLEYSADGQIEKAIEYRKGNRIGEGLVLEDGSRDGPWKEYYPGGAVKAEGVYDKGKKKGKWTYYHSNGRIEQTGKYNQEGKPEGTWLWYYETGYLLREENYYRGERDGLIEEYDEDGGLIEQGEYYNGLEDGAWIRVIGDYCQRGTFRDGLKTGIWFTFRLQENENQVDSILLFKGGFLEDLPDGKHIYYWENGNIHDEGIYIMGRKEEDWYKYNSDGTLFLITTYRNGIETKYDGIRIKPPLEPEE